MTKTSAAGRRLTRRGFGRYLLTSAAGILAAGCTRRAADLMDDYATVQSRAAGPAPVRGQPAITPGSPARTAP